MLIKKKRMQVKEFAQSGLLFGPTLFNVEKETGNCRPLL